MAFKAMSPSKVSGVDETCVRLNADMAAPGLGANPVPAPASSSLGAGESGVRGPHGFPRAEVGTREPCPAFLGAIPGVSVGSEVNFEYAAGGEG